MSIQTMSNTLVQIIVLALPTTINGSTIWMDYATLGCYAIGLLLMLLFKVEYERMSLDVGAVAI